MNIRKRKPLLGNRNIGEEKRASYIFGIIVLKTDGSGGVDPFAYVYGDHEHALRLTSDDAKYAAIDANGVLNVVGAGGIATSIVDGDLTIDGSGACLWVQDGATDYLRPRTYGRGIKIYDAAQGLAFTITPDGDVIGNIQAAGGAANRYINLADYDFGTSPGGTAAGIHDINFSGNLTSEAATTGSIIAFLGGSDIEDQVRLRNWTAYPGVGGTAIRARYNGSDGLQLLEADGTTPGFTVAAAGGHTTWMAGATWTIEGDTYTLPTAFPAASGYHLASTDAGVLSWAAPAIGVIGNGTAQWQVPVTGADPFTPVWTALSYNPGAAQKPLMSNSSGALSLQRLYIVDAGNYLRKDTDDLQIHSTANVEISAVAFTPDTTGITDLGTSSLYWRDLFLSGVAYFDDANNYVTCDGSAHLVVDGQSAVYIAVGGTNELAIGSTSVEPIVSADLDLGTNIKRFGKGHFNDTVYAAKFEDITSASFYLDPASTGSALVLAGNIVMSSGKTVDGVDVSEHVHTYDKADTPTGAGSAHHHHVSWACADTGAQIDDGGGNHHHVYQGIVNYVSGGVYTSDENEHTHGLTYTSTNSGKP